MELLEMDKPVLFEDYLLYLKGFSLTKYKSILQSVLMENSRILKEACHRENSEFIKVILQGVLQRNVILWEPRMPTKTIHGVRNVICTCSLGVDICFFTFRMNFELRDWPPQPQTFSTNSTKITKKCPISNFSFDMLEAVLASL